MVELTHTYPMPPAVHGFRYLAVVLRRTAGVCIPFTLVAFTLVLTLDDEAFGPGGLATAALLRYLWNLLWIVALGLVGTGFLLLITQYAQHWLQRRALNRYAEDRENEVPPVRWQRAALVGNRASPTMLVLGTFLTVVVGFITIAAWTVYVDDPHIGSQIVFGASVALTALGVVLLVLGSRRVKGPAKNRWDMRDRPLHPLEARRRLGGHRSLVRRLRSSTTDDDRRALAMTSPPLADLARLGRLAGWLLLAALVPGLGAAVTTGTTLVLRTCDGCEAGLTPETEAFIDTALLAGVGFLVLAGLLLLGSASLSAVVSVRLRTAILVQAAHLGAPMPPWVLLREVLREEVPFQRLLASVHTAATILLGIGLAGLRTGPEYPLSEWYVVFPPMTTLGGVLLLFHVSGWFWRRRQTAAENAALLQRWPI